MGSIRERMASFQPQELLRPITRLRKPTHIKTKAALAASLLMTALASGQTFTTIPAHAEDPTVEKGTSSIPLAIDGDGLVDPVLSRDGNPLLGSIRFWFDRNYQGGSLAMEIQTITVGEHRIISREINPRPGYLVSLPTPTSEGFATKYPVTEFVVGDQELVHIGVRLSGQPPEQTFQNTRTYSITRADEQNLTGEYLGLETLDPAAVTPRDSNVAPFFK